MTGVAPLYFVSLCICVFVYLSPQITWWCQDDRSGPSVFLYLVCLCICASVYLCVCVFVSLCICVFFFVNIQSMCLQHEGGAKRVGVVGDNSTSAANLNGLNASIDTAAAVQGGGV